MVRANETTVEQQAFEVVRIIGEHIEAGWPALVRYAPDIYAFFRKALADRFNGAPRETVMVAAERTSTAARLIGGAIDAAIASGEVTEDTAVRRMREPEFLLTISALLGDASEKSEHFWLEQASLTARALLVSKSQSRRALIVKNACKAMAGLNARQLRGLALLYLLQYTAPSPNNETVQVPAAEVLASADNLLKPFDDTIIDTIDLLMFESLNLVTILQHSRSDSRFLQQISNAMSNATGDRQVEAMPSIRRAFTLWQGEMLAQRMGLSQTKLTATGYVLGAIARSTLTGVPVPLSEAEWNEPTI